MDNTKLLIGVGVATIILGGGTLLFFKVIKPKLDAKSGKTTSNGGSTTTTGGSSAASGVVYTGLTTAQTSQLQSTLNTMAVSMALNTKKDTAETTFAKSFDGSLVVDGLYGSKTLNAVKALQTFLNAKQKSNLKIDGKYGKETEKVFKAWATANNKGINANILG